MDLGWISWVLLSTALLGVVAWLKLIMWWLRQRQQATKLKMPSLAPSPHSTSLITRMPGVSMEPAPHFPSNPEQLMWRPPSRESLLQRQQVKANLGPPEARLAGSRARLAGTRAQQPLLATIPKPPKKSSPPQTEQTMVMIPQETIVATVKLASDSRIGRKRQGLESLVNVVAALEPPPVSSVSPPETRAVDES